MSYRASPALCLPAVVLASLILSLGSTAGAHGFRTGSLTLPQPSHPLPLLVQSEAARPDVIVLLTGLARIESDLQLGMLFMADGLTNPDGSHFAHARAEVYPGLKDLLFAAGVADFEPLLVALEGGGDSATVTAGYTAAVGAIMGARSTLRPTSQEMLLSILDQSRAVAGEINPAGPTEVTNFRNAWAMLMVARNQVDLLTRGEDAAVAEAAKKMAMAFDDIIISMPDPNATAPVSFDPAPILSAIGLLEGLAGSA